MSDSPPNEFERRGPSPVNGYSYEYSNAYNYWYETEFKAWWNSPERIAVLKAIWNRPPTEDELSPPPLEVHTAQGWGSKGTPAPRTLEELLPPSWTRPPPFLPMWTGPGPPPNPLPVFGCSCPCSNNPGTDGTDEFAQRYGISQAPKRPAQYHLRKGKYRKKF